MYNIPGNPIAGPHSKVLLLHYVPGKKVYIIDESINQ
jgi:hypothetical protein